MTTNIETCRNDTFNLADRNICCQCLFVNCILGKVKTFKYHNNTYYLLLSLGILLRNMDSNNNPEILILLTFAAYIYILFSKNRGDDYPVTSSGNQNDVRKA